MRMFRQSLHPSSYPILPNADLNRDRRTISYQRYGSIPLHKFEKINRTLSIDDHYERAYSLGGLNNNRSFRPMRPKSVSKKQEEKRKRVVSGVKNGIATKQNKENMNPNVRDIYKRQFRKQENREVAPLKIERKLEQALNIDSISYTHKPVQQRKKEKNPYNLNVKFTESIYYQEKKK